jgi:hypothetical protein
MEQPQPKFPVFDITIKDTEGNILCNIKEPDELSLEYLAIIIKHKCNIDKGNFMLLYKDGKPLSIGTYYEDIHYDVSGNVIYRYKTRSGEHYILHEGLTELTLVRSVETAGTWIQHYSSNTIIHTPYNILERFNMNILKRLFGFSDSILKDSIIPNILHKKNADTDYAYWTTNLYINAHKITKYFYNKIDTFIWDGVHINYINILDEYGDLTTHNLNEIIQDLLKDLPDYFGINFGKPNGYLKILTITQLQAYLENEDHICGKSPAKFCIE